MPSPSSILSDEFVRRLKSLEQTRKEVESLCRRGELTRRATEQVYGAILLNTVTSFEELIESLFLGLLDGTLRPRTGVRPRMTFKSSVVAREVVLGGRSYVDWFPYTRFTEKRAGAFFTGGRPFTEPSDADKKFLENLMIIRNAIAHQSLHSRKQFEREIISGIALLPRERTPVGYLRSLLTPTQTRFEQLSAECARLAYQLCG